MSYLLIGCAVLYVVTPTFGGRQKPPVVPHPKCECRWHKVCRYCLGIVK